MMDSDPTKDCLDRLVTQSTRADTIPSDQSQSSPSSTESPDSSAACSPSKSRRETIDEVEQTDGLEDNTRLETIIEVDQSGHQMPAGVAEPPIPPGERAQQCHIGDQALKQEGGIEAVSIFFQTYFLFLVLQALPHCSLILMLTAIALVTIAMFCLFNGVNPVWQWARSLKGLLLLLFVTAMVGSHFVFCGGDGRLSPAEKTAGTAICATFPAFGALRAKCTARQMAAPQTEPMAPPTAFHGGGEGGAPLLSRVS